MDHSEFHSKLSESHPRSVGPRTAISSVSFAPLLLMALLPGSVLMIVFVFLAGDADSSNRHYTLFDDAMISMSYGKTLSETGELVWFPGAERVQGVTNPLWTLYMSVLHFTGLEGSIAALAVSITGLLLVLTCAVLVANIVKESVGTLPNGIVLAVLCGALVPFLYPIIFWSLRGMEVGLLATSATLLVWSVLRASKISTSLTERNVFLALAFLATGIGVTTRVDFVILAFATAIWGLLRLSQRKGLLVACAGLGLWALVCVGVVMILQWRYYGSFLPNTYTLKVEGFSLSERLVRGLINSLKYASLLSLLLGTFIMGFRRSAPGGTRRFSLELLVICSVTPFAYNIWVGGDAWEWSMLASRFVAVVLPLMLASIGICSAVIATYIRDAPNSKSVLVACLIISTLLLLGAGALTNPVEYDLGRAVVLTVSVGALFALALFLVINEAAGSLARLLLSVSIIVPVVAIVSVLPVARSLLTERSVGPLVVADASVTQKAKSTSDLLMPGAEVAVVWAGAPSYYLGSSYLDILGKSDSYIASTAPRRDAPSRQFATLFPGHNKWNYDYTVGQQRPDVIFQLWQTDSSLLGKLASWGYQPYCLSSGEQIWVQQISNRVHREKLRDCP